MRALSNQNNLEKTLISLTLVVQFYNCIVSSYQMQEQDPVKKNTFSYSGTKNIFGFFFLVKVS